MNKTIKDHVITFRVTEEEYEKIDRCGMRAGQNTNDWCRCLVLAEVNRDYGLTPNDRILIEEMAVQRMMMGEILREMLSEEEVTKIRQKADLKYAEYGRMILAKRTRDGA
jgi:hypothetical protein